MLPGARQSARGSRKSTSTGLLSFIALVLFATFFIVTAAYVLERSDAVTSGSERQQKRQRHLAAAPEVAFTGAAALAVGASEAPADDSPADDSPAKASAEASAPPDRGAPSGGSLSGLQPHPEPACAALLKESADVMFMVVGGRGYHDVRTRVILRSWARCLAHFGTP